MSAEGERVERLARDAADINSASAAAFPPPVPRADRVTGQDFAVRMAGSDYRFAVGAKESAAALRKLADQIESGALIMQGCRYTQMAKVDDFFCTELALQYVERDPV